MLVEDAVEGVERVDAVEEIKHACLTRPTWW